MRELAQQGVAPHCPLGIVSPLLAVYLGSRYLGYQHATIQLPEHPAAFRGSLGVLGGSPWIYSVVPGRPKIKLVNLKPNQVKYKLRC